MCTSSIRARRKSDCSSSRSRLVSRSLLFQLPKYCNVIGENCTGPLPNFAEVGRACETKDGYGYTDQSVIKFTEICGRYGEVCCRLHTLFRRVCTNRSQARNETKVASSYNLSTVSLNYKHNSFKFSVQRDHG